MSERNAFAADPPPAKAGGTGRTASAIANPVRMRRRDNAALECASAIMENLPGRSKRTCPLYLWFENGSVGEKFIRADRPPIGPRLQLASSRILAPVDPTVPHCRPRADRRG